MSRCISVSNRLVPVLSETEFTQAVAVLPLVSADLIVVNPARELLLGLRRNHPAQGYWFSPGGRVRKNEPFTKCLQRVAQQELGLNTQMVQSAKLMGVWDHLYNNSAFSADVKAHYVNLPHLLKLEHLLALDTLPTDQHASWRWQAAEKAAVDKFVHPYAQVYAQWVVRNCMV